MGLSKIINNLRLRNPTTGAQREIPTTKIWRKVYVYKTILRTDILTNLKSSDIKALDEKISKIYKSWWKWTEKLQWLENIRKEYENMLEQYRQELEQTFKEYNIQTNITTGKETIKWSQERFNTVTELYLYNNKNLTELPQRIQKFPNLNYLSIGNAPNLTELPTWIKKIPIKKLDLVQTGIKQFPQALYYMDLQRLDIRWTKIRTPQDSSEEYHLSNFLKGIKEQWELYMGDL